MAILFAFYIKCMQGGIAMQTGTGTIPEKYSGDVSLNPVIHEDQIIPGFTGSYVAIKIRALKISLRQKKISRLVDYRLQGSLVFSV